MRIHSSVLPVTLPNFGSSQSRSYPPVEIAEKELPSSNTLKGQEYRITLGSILEDINAINPLKQMKGLRALAALLTAPTPEKPEPDDLLYYYALSAILVHLYTHSQHLPFDVRQQLPDLYPKMLQQFSAVMRTALFQNRRA